MKKIIILFSCLGLLACEQHKIGYVDSLKLLGEYQEKVDAETRFNTRTAALGKKRDSISQAFQIEAQALQSRAQSMSQKKAQEEYQLFQKRGQFIGQQLQQEEQVLQQQGQIEIDSIVSKVKREIEAYGKANGYTYILGGGDGGGVLYGTENKDLTSEILKILNDKYKK